MAIIPSMLPPMPPPLPTTGMGNGRPTVLDSDNNSSAYATANNVEVRYAPQSNGLTTPVDTVVTGPTRVLESSRKLMEGWSGAAGSQAPTNPLQAAAQANQPTPLLSQVENDVVQVNHPSKQPLVHLDDGDLEGSPNITSPFVTANQVNETVEGDLGRDVRYNSPDGRLNINVDTPSHQPNESPYHSPGTGTLTFPATSTGDNLANDPDVIAHEQGHAILDSQRPDMDFAPESKAAHEGFSDGVAFFQSLQQDEVKQDTIQRWDNPEGPQSGLASNVSEAGSQYFGTGNGGQAEGLRDLSTPAPTGSVDSHGHHRDSMKFSTALHDSTRDVYQQLRKDNPNLTSEQAYDQATDRVRSDFYRSLDFLPPGGTISQSDLGAAMMQANGVDSEGAQQQLYRGNFEEAGLRPVTADSAAQQAGLQAIGERVGLPSGLAGQNFQAGVDDPNSEVRTQANAFLEKNGSALGIPQGYDMEPTRVYTNDRGETFMSFRGQREGGTPADPTELLGVGFNSDGQMIHLDSAQKDGISLPPMQMPLPFPVPGNTPAPGGNTLPPIGGGFPSLLPPPLTGGSGNDQVPSWTGGGSGNDKLPPFTFPSGHQLPSVPHNGNSGHNHSH